MRAITLTACILASSMAFIDGSALTVALPQLRTEFGGNITAVQWVLNGYILALAAFTMIGGALADSYGRARMLIWGCAAFGLASLACALSSGAAMLVTARIFQGLAAAIVTPSSLALIGEVFARQDRARAIGIWAGASALTTAAGPVLGGWLTETFSWRGVFWINLPIAVAAVSLLLATRRPALTNARAFDVAGAVLLALALTGLAYGLSALGPGEGGSGEPPEIRLAPSALSGLLLGVLLFVAFLFWERRATQPMVPPGLFASRCFSGLNLATLLIYIGLSITFFLLPFHLIENYNLTATQAGMVFLPFTLLVGVTSGYFGGLADRIGTKALLIAGPLLAAAGFALFVVNAGLDLVYAALLPMGVAGLGFAAIVAPLTSAVMNSVDGSDEGLASGINNTASRIAQMVGIALAALFVTAGSGFVTGMAIAATLCAAGALVILLTLPGQRQPDAGQAKGAEG